MAKARRTKRSSSPVATNTRVRMLSREFLESKVNALLNYWKENEVFGWGGKRCDSKSFIHVPTQVYETESTCLRFILWNLIRGFKGHYECVVDTDTFHYSVKQYAYYGSLTWTTPAKDHKVYTMKDLSNEQRLEIEASIALTIIKCKFVKENCGRIDIVDKSFQLRIWGQVFSDDLSIPFTPRKNA